MKVVELEETVGGKVKIVEMLNNELASKDQIHSENQKMIAVLQRTVQQINDQNSLLTQEAETSKKEAEDEKTRAAEAEGNAQERILQWQSQTNEATTQIDNLKQEIASFEEKLVEKDGEKSELQEKLVEEQKKVSDLENSVARINEEKEALNNDIEKLETSVKEEQTNVQTLGQHVQARDQLLAQQRNQFDQTTKESESRHDAEQTKLKQEIEEHKRSIDTHKTTISELQNDKLSLNQAKQACEVNIQALSEQLRMLQEDSNVRAAEFGEREKQIEANSNAKHQQMEQKLQQDKIAIAKVEAERDIMKDRLDALKLQVETANNDSYQQSVSWRKEKMEMDSQLLDLRTQLEKQVKEHQGIIRNHNQEILKLNDQHKTQIEDLENLYKDDMKREMQEVSHKTGQTERSLNQKLLKLEKDNSEKKIKLENLQLKYSELEQDILSKNIKLEEESKALEELRSTAKTEQLKFEEKLSELESKLKNKEKELTELGLDAENNKTTIVNETAAKEKIWASEKQHLEQYLRSVGEHVKALQEQSEKHKEKWSEEKTVLEKTLL